MSSFVIRVMIRRVTRYIDQKKNIKLCTCSSAMICFFLC